MTTYQQETFANWYADAQHLIHQHWAELAMDKGKIPLSMNVEGYQNLERNGSLVIVTARELGDLIGYYLAFVFPHLHYVDMGLMAFTDAYWVMPDRRYGVGVNLFIEAERVLKAMGVVKGYLSCKVHQDHSKLFEALGWKLTDLCFTKFWGKN